MKKIPLTPELKSFLISAGSADIDDALLSGGLKTQATAGPGAGGSSFFFSSGGHRVRLSINRNSPLKAVKWDDGIAIVKDGALVVTGYLEEPLCHCPGQAYITICERCVYDCKFCPVPKLQGERKDIPTILRLVGDACARGGMQAISLTSGVEVSPEDEVRKTVEVIKELKKHFSVPIGVSVYPTETSSEELRRAGAVEIKYNIETMDPEIFSRVCPGLSLERSSPPWTMRSECSGKTMFFPISSSDWEKATKPWRKAWKIWQKWGLFQFSGRFRQVPTVPERS